MPEAKVLVSNPITAICGLTATLHLMALQSGCFPYMRWLPEPRNGSVLQVDSALVYVSSCLFWSRLVTWFP